MVGSFQQRYKWHFIVAFLLMWTRFVENISTSVSSPSLYGSLLSLNRSKTSILSEVKPTLNSSVNGASSTTANLFKFFNSSAKSVVLHKPSLNYSLQNSPSSRSSLYSTTSVLAHTQSSDVNVISTPIVTLPSSSGIVTSPILPSRPSALEQKRNHSTFVASTFQGISFTKGEQHSADRRLNSSLFVDYSNVSSSIRYAVVSSATTYAVSSISTTAKSDYSESYNASEKIAPSLTILSTGVERHIVLTQSTNTSNDGNLRTGNYLSGTSAHDDTTRLPDLQTKTVDAIVSPINRSRTILKSSMTEAVQSVKNTLSTMYPIQNTKEYRSNFTSLLHTAPRPTSALSVQPMSRDESFGTKTTQALLSLIPSVHYNLEISSTRTPMPWNNSSTMNFTVLLAETSSTHKFGSINSTIQNGLVGATITPMVNSSGQQSINETIASVPLGTSFSPAVSSNGQHNEIESTPISVWVSVTQRASSNVQRNINGTIEVVERLATTSRVVPIGASYTLMASSDGQYNKSHTSATRSVPVIMASVTRISSNNGQHETVAIRSIPVEMSVTLIANGSWQYNTGVSTTTQGVPSGASTTLIANSTELHNMNVPSTILGASLRASTALIASSSGQHNMNGTSATHIDAVGSSFTLIANSREQQLNPSTTKILQSDTANLSASFSRGGKLKVNTSIPFNGMSSSVYRPSNGQHDASATKIFHTLPLLPSSSEGLVERNNTNTKSTRTPTLETSWTAPSIVNFSQSLSRVFDRPTSVMSETIARKSDGYSLGTVTFLQSSRAVSNSQNVWLTSAVKVKTNLSQSTISLVKNGSEVLSTDEFPTLSRMTLSYTPTPSLVHHSPSLSEAKFVTSHLLNKSSIVASKDSSEESPRASNSPKSFSELTSRENIIIESTSAPTWVIPSVIFTVSHSSAIASNYGLPSTTVKPDVSRMSSSKINSKMAGYSVVPIITPCYISYVITITQRIMESFSSVFVGDTSSPSLFSSTTVHHQQSEDRSFGLTLQPTPSTTRTLPYFTMESLSTSVFQTKSLSVLPEQDQSSLTLEVTPSVSSSALYNPSTALRTTSNNVNTSVFELNSSVPVSSLQSPVATWSSTENKSQTNLTVTEHTRSTTALDTTPVMTSSIFHVSSFKPSTGEPQATANLTTSEKSFSSHIFSRVVSSIATSYGYNNSSQATVVTSQSRDTWPISSKIVNSSVLHLTSVLPTFSLLNTSSANAKTSLKEKSLSTESMLSMQSSHLGIKHIPSSSNITHTVTHRPEETPMSLFPSSSKANVVAISSLVTTTGIKLDNKTSNIAPTLVNSYHVASSYFRNGTSTWSIDGPSLESIPALVSATTFISDTSTVQNPNITSDSAIPVVSGSPKLMVNISETNVPSFSFPKSSFFESASSLQTSTVVNSLSTQSAVQNVSAAESRAWLHSPTSLNPTLTMHAYNSINETVHGFTRVLASSQVLSFVNNTPMATTRLFSSQAVVTTSADRYLKESGSLEESSAIITSISNVNPGQSSASDESSVYFRRNASLYTTTLGTLSHSLMPVSVPSIIPANHSNPVSTFLDVPLGSKTSSSVGRRVSVAPSVNTSSLISTWVGDRYNSTSLTTSYNITSPSSAIQSSANYSDTISPFFLLKTTSPSVTPIARRKRRDVQNSPLLSNSTSTGSVSDEFVSLSASVIAPTKPMIGTSEIVSVAATITKDLLSSSTAVDRSVQKSVSLKPSSPIVGEGMSGTLITRTPSLGVSLLLETTDHISNTSTFQDSRTTKQSRLRSHFDLKNSSYVVDSTSDSPSAKDRLLETSVSRFLELSSESLPVSASKIVNGTAVFNRSYSSYIPKFLALSTGSLLTSATKTFSETVPINKTSTSAVSNFSAHSTASFPAFSSKTFSETVAVNKTSSSTASNFSAHSTDSLHAFSSTKTFRETVAVNKTSTSAVSNFSAHSTASFPAFSSKTFSETVAVNKTSTSAVSNFSAHSTASFPAFSSKTFSETVAVNKTSTSAVSNFSAHSTASFPAFSSKTFSETVAVNKTSTSAVSNFSAHSTASFPAFSSKTFSETVAVNKTSTSAVSNFSAHSTASFPAFSSKTFSETVAVNKTSTSAVSNFSAHSTASFPAFSSKTFSGPVAVNKTSSSTASNFSAHSTDSLHAFSSTKTFRETVSVNKTSTSAVSNFSAHSTASFPAFSSKTFSETVAVNKTSRSTASNFSAHSTDSLHAFSSTKTFRETVAVNKTSTSAVSNFSVHSTASFPAFSSKTFSETVAVNKTSRSTASNFSAHSTDSLHAFSSTKTFRETVSVNKTSSSAASNFSKQSVSSLQAFSSKIFSETVASKSLLQVTSLSIRNHDGPNYSTHAILTSAMSSVQHDTVSARPSLTVLYTPLYNRVANHSQNRTTVSTPDITATSSLKFLVTKTPTASLTTVQLLPSGSRFSQTKAGEGTSVGNKTVLSTNLVMNKSYDTTAVESNNSVAVTQMLSSTVTYFNEHNGTYAIPKRLLTSPFISSSQYLSTSAGFPVMPTFLPRSSSSNIPTYSFASAQSSLSRNNFSKTRTLNNGMSFSSVGDISEKSVETSAVPFSSLDTMVPSLSTSVNPKLPVHVNVTRATSFASKYFDLSITADPTLTLGSYFSISESTSERNSSRMSLQSATKATGFTVTPVVAPFTWSSYFQDTTSRTSSHVMNAINSSTISQKTTTASPSPSPLLTSIMRGRLTATPSLSLVPQASTEAISEIWHSAKASSSFIETVLSSKSSKHGQNKSTVVSSVTEPSLSQLSSSPMVTMSIVNNKNSRKVNSSSPPFTYYIISTSSLGNCIVGYSTLRHPNVTVEASLSTIATSSLRNVSSRDSLYSFPILSSVTGNTSSFIVNMTVQPTSALLLKSSRHNASRVLVSTLPRLSTDLVSSASRIPTSFSVLSVSPSPTLHPSSVYDLPSSSHWSTITPGNSSISGVSSVKRESASISGVSSTTRESPSISGVSSMTRESPSISGVSSMTRESPSISGVSSMTRESPSISGVSSMTRESPSISGVSSMTRESPSISEVSSMTRESPSISGVSSMTRESASISEESSMTRESPSIFEVSSVTRGSSISGVSSVKRDSTSISGVFSVIRESASISEILPSVNLITPSLSSLRPSTIPSSSVAVTSAPTSAVDDEDALLLIVIEVPDTVVVTTNQFKNTMEEKLNKVYQNGRQSTGRKRKRRNTAVYSSVKVMDIKRSGKKVDVKYIVMEDNKTVSAVDAAKKMNVFTIQTLGTMIGYDVLLRPEPAPRDVPTDNIVAMLVKTSSKSNLSTLLVKQSFEGELADFYKSSSKGRPLGQIIKATVTRIYFEPLARTYVEFVITVDNVTVNQSIVQNVFDSPTNVLTAKLDQVVLVAPYIPSLLKPTMMDYIIQTMRYTNEDDLKAMEAELPTKLSRVYLAAKQKVSRKRRKRALGSVDAVITIPPPTENFLVDVKYYITDGGSVLNATYACAILNRLTTNEMTQITTPFIVNTSPSPLQPTTSKTSDNNDDPPWLIIAILAGSVGLLLVIILIILYCRWKKGTPSKKINPGVTSPGEEQLPRPRMTYAADQNERPDLHRARPPPRTAVSVEENGQGPSGRPPLRKLPVRENSMRKKVSSRETLITSQTTRANPAFVEESGDESVTDDRVVQVSRVPTRAQGVRKKELELPRKQDPSPSVQETLESEEGSETEGSDYASMYTKDSVFSDQQSVAVVPTIAVMTDTPSPQLQPPVRFRTSVHPETNLPPIDLKQTSLVGRVVEEEGPIQQQLKSKADIERWRNKQRQREKMQGESQTKPGNRPSFTEKKAWGRAQQEIGSVLDPEAMQPIVRKKKRKPRRKYNMKTETTDDEENVKLKSFHKLNSPREEKSEQREQESQSDSDISMREARRRMIALLDDAFASMKPSSKKHSRENTDNVDGNRNPHNYPSAYRPPLYPRPATSAPALPEPPPAHGRATAPSARHRRRFLNSQNSLPYPSHYYPGTSGGYSPGYPPPPPPPVVTRNPVVVWDPADKQRLLNQSSYRPYPGHPYTYSDPSSKLHFTPVQRTPDGMGGLVWSPYATEYAMEDFYRNVGVPGTFDDNNSSFLSKMQETPLAGAPDANAAPRDTVIDMGGSGIANEPGTVTGQSAEPLVRAIKDELFRLSNGRTPVKHL